MKVIYKTRIVVEVLSEEPINENYTLKDIYDEYMEGEFSGQITRQVTTKLMGKTAANAIVKQGSDPEFFGLDSNGKEI